MDRFSWFLGKIIESVLLVGYVWFMRIDKGR